MGMFKHSNTVYGLTPSRDNQLLSPVYAKNLLSLLSNGKLLHTQYYNIVFEVTDSPGGGTGLWDNLFTSNFIKI
jgi:hypothetical protein